MIIKYGDVMPKTNDNYVVTLKKAHLEWGTHRYTGTRDATYGEGYLQIPRKIAESFEIYNSNHSTASTEYTCSSTDGFLNSVILKASGSSTSGDIFAKQFQGSGDLKVLGEWYHHVNAQEGDQVKISWVSPTEMLIGKV